MNNNLFCFFSIWGCDASVVVNSTHAPLRRFVAHWVRNSCLWMETVLCPDHTGLYCMC